MTEKDLKYFIIKYIDNKVSENEEYIRYSYYDLKVKNNLTEKEIDEVLRVSRDYFENKGYCVYFTGARFIYNNTNMTVQDNELMIAIKQ